MIQQNNKHMPARLADFRRFVLLFHRWSGTAFCLLFVWWFASGMVMMYWSFPSVEASDRLMRALPLNASQVRLSPFEAWLRAGSPAPLRKVWLETFDGRPTYWLFTEAGRVAVFADNGEVRTAFSPEINTRTAAAWVRQPVSAARLVSLAEADQWTVNGIFRARQPLTKYSFPNGEDVYVQDRTGEVVQYTASSSRLWAYAGAIPHWMYFTPLRKNRELWRRIVIWSSGTAALVALAGLISGLLVYFPKRRVPYSGQKRLHLILGLVFGLFACTWSFSGMLSMEPFPALGSGNGSSEGSAGDRIARALAPAPLQLERFASKHPREALNELGSQFAARRLELRVFHNEPLYIASAGPQHSRLIPIEGSARTAYDLALIRSMAENAARPFRLAETRLLTEYDSYYLDRRSVLPLPVLLLKLDDADGGRYYIDVKRAEIAGEYSKRSWAQRWLYHGLHSLDLPWLYKHRPAWDILVLLLMLGGTTFSGTGVILAAQLLSRKLG